MHNIKKEKLTSKTNYGGQQQMAIKQDVISLKQNVKSISMMFSIKLMIIIKQRPTVDTKEKAYHWRKSLIHKEKEQKRKEGTREL